MSQNYDFSFLVQRRLFQYDLHEKYIVSIVKCTFHLTIDVQSLKTFYLLFADLFLIFLNFIFVYVRMRRHTQSNLRMSKTQIFRYRDKILRIRERLSYTFRNYNLLRSKLGSQCFFRLRTPLSLKLSIGSKLS